LLSLGISPPTNTTTPCLTTDASTLFLAPPELIVFVFVWLLGMLLSAPWPKPSLCGLLTLYLNVWSLRFVRWGQTQQSAERIGTVNRRRLVDVEVESELAELARGRTCVRNLQWDHLPVRCGDGVGGMGVGERPRTTEAESEQRRLEDEAPQRRGMEEEAVAARTDEERRRVGLERDEAIKAL
jgi:hypothetical protein